MSAAHTPGPWFLLESDGVLQISDSEKHGNKAAIVHWAGFDAGDKTKKAKRANARLIAAAPELLQLVIDCIESPNEFETEWNKAARAVVAKARGQS